MSNCKALYGIIFIISGCASAPEYREIVSHYADMRVEVPESVPVEMRPLESLECAAGFCTLSEADYETRTADLQALARVKQTLELENQSRARAHNLVVDALTHTDMAYQAERNARESLEKAIERERLSASLRQWLERGIFVLGLYVLGL